ncbi:MAG: anaerobic sulfatase maturase [Sphaerochaetaceae bacterium]|nr:anaerobic sulfatase maturase [Sphaerochaetaceae bacterium]
MTTNITKHVQYPFNMMAKPIGPLCNLDCEYCYYLKKEKLFSHCGRSEFRMSDEVLRRYIQQYIASQPENTPEVIFGWQGGEPTLLGVEYFEKVLRLQKKYNQRNIVIRNALQTNGTLITDEMARFFKNNEFLIGVSIDGPEKLHDRYRKDRSGKGSFSSVMAGLEKLKRYDVDFNTLTVVQNDNSNYPVEVYQFLKEIGSRYLQFIPIVEPPLPASKRIAGKRSVDPLMWGKFLVSVFQKWIATDIHGISVQHFDVTLGQYLNMPSALCVHSKYCGKALVIEHDGNIYNCDHFVNPENYAGNIMKDDLADIVSSDKQVAFGMNKYDGLPQECLKCPYLPLCYGGCQKDRLVGGKNWLCDGYRYYYEKTFPVFSAMAQAVKYHRLPSEFRNFLRLTPEVMKQTGRNEPCPCLSGKKFKNCHGKNL